MPSANVILVVLSLLVKALFLLYVRKENIEEKCFLLFLNMAALLEGLLIQFAYSTADILAVFRNKANVVKCLKDIKLVVRREFVSNFRAPN